MDPKLTNEQWLAYLEPLLDAQSVKVQQFMDYYDGDHKLDFATQRFKEAFARYFTAFANNWMQIVVDTPVSRLSVQGFRFGGPNDGDDIDIGGPKPAADAPRDPQTGALKDAPWELEADDDAWNIWQASNLDSLSRMIHTDAVKMGVSYVSIHAPDETKVKSQYPRICPEHPTQVYVACDPEDRTHRLAAIKRWISDFDDTVYCDLYLADGKFRYQSDKQAQNGAVDPNAQWVLRSDTESFVPYPGGVVPIVPIENKPDLLTGGHSDLENAIPIQDAINKLCLDMMVTSEFHAYPQRYAVGWDKAVDDSGRELSNNEVELYLAANRMIRAESPETKFGEFAQANMENYLGPIGMYIDHLAVQTQTPVYYLKGKAAAISADAMHSFDQGLVDRCKAKINSFSDGWEEVLRCAFLMLGDEQKGTAQAVEVVWEDIESFSMAVAVQAAVMMRTSLSVPIEMCWEYLGWSPAKIRLARDIMNLPPGGPQAVNAGMGPGQGPIPQVPGGGKDPNENDPAQHPGNQPGQPSGFAYQGEPKERQ